MFNEFVDRRMAEYAANNDNNEDEVDEDDASVRSDDAAPREKTKSMCMNALQSRYGVHRRIRFSERAGLVL